MAGGMQQETVEGLEARFRAAKDVVERSIPGIAEAFAMLIEMEELESRRRASAGLAPISRRSGKWQGHERIQRGRDISEEQVIGILKEETGSATADVCRRHGIGSATFYKWKAKFGGLEVSDARRLKALEEEHVRLKRLLADAMLDNAILKDVAGKKWTPTPGGRRWFMPVPRTE